MSTVCYLLGIILCISATVVSGVPFYTVSPGPLGKVYKEMAYSIEQKAKGEAFSIKAGFEYVISAEFLGKAAIPFDTKYDSEALVKFPGIVAVGTLGGNFVGVLQALRDMTTAGYPGQSILVIYALDYWTPGDERSQDDTKFYIESMSILSALKAAGARVYRFTTWTDPQRTSQETDVCFFDDVQNLIMDLYDSSSGLMYVDGWMGTGAQKLDSPEARSRMEVSTIGLYVVITSLQNIIAFNSRQASSKNVVGICNDINSGLQGTTGSIIAPQYFQCKYLFSMFVSKPFVNIVEDIMKDVTVLVLFLQPKEGSLVNFYDTALTKPKDFGLNAEEIVALKIYQEQQQMEKRFAVHDASTHQIVA